MEGEGSDSEAKIIDDNDDSHKWNEFNPPTHDQTWTDGDPEGAKAAVPPAMFGAVSTNLT